MPEVQSSRPFRILLVEDSPSDVRLLKEALKEASIPVRMTSVGDGVEAMEYLNAMLVGTQPRPDLVILDLNLPRKSGREVLAEIKSNSALVGLAILVMTSSNADEYISFVFSYDADSFITKPSALSDYIGIVKAIEDFWMLSEKASNAVNFRFPHFEPYAKSAERPAPSSF